MARRPAALLLCLVFALLCVLPGFVAAEAETKTIRVGWYETPFNRRIPSAAAAATPMNTSGSSPPIPAGNMNMWKVTGPNSCRWPWTAVST